MRLYRAHGLGNDYLVLEEGPSVSAELVRFLCDRHRGVGADGVPEPFSTKAADYGVTIWNPDGSIAEKSGNGLRIFARWLVDCRAALAAFTVWTGYDRVRCEVDRLIRVEMGSAVFREPLRLEVCGRSLEVVVLSLGNPHCVHFTEDPDALPWRALGAALEVHPAFPNRTNVQFSSNGKELVARIWERGAGETMASGSSACAVAAAAVRTGLRPAGAISVHMEGGQLEVEVDEAFGLVLTGPVEPIGHIEVDPSWLAARV